MPKNLPDVAGSATLGRGDLVRFARLEGQIEKALQVAREPIGAALRAIRDDKLYLATHASFERYVVERWGFSKATAYRMMEGEKLVGISPPEDASSQVSTSHGETDSTQPSTTGLPPEEETPDERVAASPAVTDGPTERPARPAVTRRPSAPPTGPSGDGPSAPESGSDGGSTADVLSATPEPRNVTGPVPSLRQEASAAFSALHDATEGIGAKWTVEEATYWENRTQREMDAWRKANRIDTPKPRRQGTISRPADRVPKPPVKVNGAPIAGSLTRRTVEPMFKGQ